jgi:diguanylate cyclase (GGDEF)-like protein/PAS domain S-box-containing protein
MMLKDKAKISNLDFMEVSFDTLRDGVFVITVEAELLSANITMREWLGVSCECESLSIKKIRILDCIDIEFRSEFSNKLKKTLKTENSRFTCYLKLNDYRQLFEFYVNRVVLEKKTYFLGFAKEIQDREKQGVEKYKTSYLGRSLDQVAESILITDSRGIVEYVNEAYIKKTGYKREAVIGANPNIVKSGHHTEKYYKNLWNTINKGKVFRGILKNKKKNGNYYYEEKIITPIKDNSGEITHFISTGRDITKRLRKQGEVDFMAHHDPLTNFYNRGYLNKKLIQIIHNSLNNNKMAACFFIDLDDFKAINDVYGHECGDKVLKTVASRIQTCTRSRDVLARIGGDEFIVIMPELKSTTDASMVAEKIINTIKHNMSINDVSISISASVGVAIIPDHGKSIEQIIKNSDSAMYHSKSSGKNTFSVYEHEYTYDKPTTERLLAKALKDDDFMLHFQPVFDAEENEVFYFEALLRWQHNSRVIPPFRFISLAENSGLIHSMTIWVVNEVCRKQKQWKLLSGYYSRVAINVSSHCIKDGNFIDEMLRAIKSHGLNPSCFVVEVSESQFSSSMHALQVGLNVLHDMGFKLVLDNFGTGNLSVSDLSYLPFDFIKIDRSFLNVIPGDGNEESLLTALIDLVISMNFEVIIQGVETGYQKMLLNFLGCKLQQGFCFSKPLSAKDICNVYLSDNKTGI